MKVREIEIRIVLRPFGGLGLEEELQKIERLAEEKQLKLSEKIIEKLRAIRRAVSGYDLPYDP